MKASINPLDNQNNNHRLPFNIFGMPKVDLYRDFAEEKEPRKDI
jgi:hypothetical protein